MNLANVAGCALAGAERAASLASGDAARQVAGLRERAHRPWPVPDGPWVMGQSWRDLLFAHWRMPPDALRAAVPEALALDVRDGAAWLGITPFELYGLRPRGTVPLPRVSRFPELNVRTYVTFDGRPGIHFFSLDAASAPAVAAARRLYHLPYFRADMRIVRSGGWIAYTSERAREGAPRAAFSARFRPVGPARPPAHGSLERWLTERYRLYTVDGRASLLAVDIHHPPWSLRRAEARIRENTMAASVGLELRDGPLLHFADRQDVVVWPPARVRLA